VNISIINTDQYNPLIKIIDFYPEKVIRPSFLAIEIKCLDYLQIQEIRKKKNIHHE
jgi:hypothetical protein